MEPIPVIWCSAVLLSAEPKHLGNIRQLTEGGQNAEAYWSPDGKRLIFQSTRKGYECDQIFIMNADGSDQKLVSTGKGRTTCGSFLGDGKHIVYASTHAAGEACPPSPDRSKGYVWGVFPGYDIYLATDDGRIQKKLTDAPGYDAEATVNWKTGKIVYTSLASIDPGLRKPARYTRSCRFSSSPWPRRHSRPHRPASSGCGHRRWQGKCRNRERRPTRSLCCGPATEDKPRPLRAWRRTQCVFRRPENSRRWCGPCPSRPASGPTRRH